MIELDYTLAWWPGRFLTNPPEEGIVIHAGFDPASREIKPKFPHMRLCVLDFFDATKITEPSIQRTHRLNPPPALEERITIRARFDELSTRKTWSILSSWTTSGLVVPASGGPASDKWTSAGTCSRIPFLCWDSQQGLDRGNALPSLIPKKGLAFRGAKAVSSMGRLLGFSRIMAAWTSSWDTSDCRLLTENGGNMLGAEHAPFVRL